MKTRGWNAMLPCLKNKLEMESWLSPGCFASKCVASFNWNLESIKIGFSLFHEFTNPRWESPNPVSDVVLKCGNKMEGMASKNRTCKGIAQTYFIVLSGKKRVVY